MSRYDVAVELVGEGIPVFPCNPNKKPRTTRGFKDATTDLDQVDKWFLDSDSLIGVPTGQQFFVVDIDPPGAEWYQQNAPRLKCACINTTRRGWHLAYAMPEGATITCSASRLAPGVDVRGMGGYVIWWPGEDLPATGTLNDIGPAPEWLLQALQALQALQTLTTNPNGHDHAADQRPENHRTISEGGRNQKLTAFGGKLRHDGLTAPEIEGALQVINIERCKPPLSAAEVHGIAESVARYQPGSSTDSHKFALDPDAARIGVDTFTHQQPAPEFPVDNFILNDVGAVIGAGGMSKTTLMLNIACPVILGLPVFGHEVTRPGAVLFLSAEDGAERMRYRLHRYGLDAHLTAEQREQVGAGFFLEDFSDRNAQLVKLDGRGNLEEQPLVDALIDAYGPLHLSLVIMDPFVSFGPGERMVNDGEQSVIRAARRIRKALNCPVVFAVHTGKQNARESRTDQYAFRGGSALADGMRFLYVLDRAEGISLPNGIDPRDAAEGKVFRLTQAKCTDAAPWTEPLWLVRHGFRFIEQAVSQQSADEARQQAVDKLVQFIRTELKAGVPHSKTSLESARDRIPMARNACRDAIHRAVSTGLLIETDLPEDQRHGGRKSYFQVAR